MGEAKRRALSDPDYGQVFNLDSTAAKTQHCDAVIDELFTTFATEIKFLIRTARFPDNYDLICTHITDWRASKITSISKK